MIEAKTIAEMIQDLSPYYKKKGGPEVEHKLVYDSSTETLEPIYFFILDLMEDMRLETEKLVDNFTSSPGSGHFAELGQRASIMQQQGAKILGDVNTVLRSILNLLYDLKEFRIRLQSYEDLKSKSQSKKEAAILSLKQIWIDKVDLVQKGNSSIKAMALGQGGFQTLLHAFLIVKDEKDAEKLDLGDAVKRIVKPRIAEFNSWIGQSGAELKKRYELEKIYLRSQVNSLKLYTRWAKPYLRAATQLETKDFGRNPALVKVFNTLMLELTLIGKSELKVEDAAVEGELPADFKKKNFTKSLKRKYYSCVLVDFKFRGIPQRTGNQAHYVFGGKVEVSFKAYALNDEELKKLNQELDNSDIGDALKLVEGSTTESLEKMQDEINFFLEEKDQSKEKEQDGSNPFLALIGYYEKPSEKKKEETSTKKIIVESDNWIEKTHLRPLAAVKCSETAFRLFDLYKKAHGMPSYP